MQESVSELNGTTWSVIYHWLIMILLLGISKNKIVLATFCIPVLQQSLPIHSAIACTLCSSPLPQSYRVLVLELQARRKINKRNGWKKKIQISAAIKQLLAVWPFKQLKAVWMVEKLFEKLFELCKYNYLKTYKNLPALGSY